MCALALLIVDHRFDYLDRVRTVLSALLHPLHLAADAPVALVRVLQERLTNEAHLRAQNLDLSRQNLLLNARLQQFDALEAENVRLRELLGSSLNLGERVLIAEILAVDLTPSRQQVMVNKGTRAGVFVGQPVLDANAVMGQVIRANPFSSIVLLITDSDHALPVEVNRNGLRSIAAGTGVGQELDLLHIPKNADIREGDLLVTSGMGERFPPGYPVARVKLARQDPDNPFMTVLAEPTARLDRSREVLLVWTLNPRIPQEDMAGAPTMALGHE